MDERPSEHRIPNPRSQDRDLGDQPLAGACPRIVPDLEEICRLDPCQLPAVLAELSALLAAVAARLAQQGRAPVEPGSIGDRLLDVDQAAALLGISKDFAYSSPTLKSLRVKVGSRVLFSHRRQQNYIDRQAGR
jgi:hypothetical protein